jgi:hypothetical protein
MISSPYDIFPAAKRAAVRQAMSAAFGGPQIDAAEPIMGGASGAGKFKIAVQGTDYLLRIEAPPDGFRDPARQYLCMRAAAEAGVAPRLLHADAGNGLVITDFIHAMPIAEDAPNTQKLATMVQAVMALQATPLFPRVTAYPDIVDFLIMDVHKTGIMPESDMEEHLHLYRRLAAIYPRNDSDLVSSHNDLNPSNILFRDGRAWIVDWETAFAADRYVDIATLAIFFALGEAEEDFILDVYLGKPPDDYQRARLFLMQQIKRMFYTMVLLRLVAGAQPEIRLTAKDLNAPRFHDVRHEMASLTTCAGQIRFACVFWSDALRHMQSERFEETIALLKSR